MIDPASLLCICSLADVDMAISTEWAARLKVAVTSLSMDAVNSATNLRIKAATWTELLKCYQSGFVTATVHGGHAVPDFL